MPEVYEQVNGGLSYGSGPRSASDLRGLYDRGVRVVVSVDAALPMVEEARAIGIRMIHIPTRYSGIDDEALAALKRVSMEVKEPLFLHCHHGKHRGPTATAIMGMFRNELSLEEALRLMSKAGTGKEYVGLWKAVRDFESRSSISASPELYERQPADQVAGQMLIADESMEMLQKLAVSKSSHDDIEGIAHQIVLLREAIAESRRFSDPEQADLMEQFTKSEDLIRRLGRAAAKPTEAAFSDTLQSLGTSCKDCHRDHRN